jgi:DGQHR domain-containing protein
MFQFYLGAPEASWLSRLDVPLFVSRRTLGRLKRLPRALAPWALDSGGFTELSMHGGWQTTSRQYAAEVRRFQDEIGQLRFAASMDYMCEPPIVRRTGLSVAEHQRRTVDGYLRLLDIAPDLPWMPVVQGWSAHGDHLRCVDLYEQAGIDLHTLPCVGVGTICRRQDTESAERIVTDLHERIGCRLHGFGVKLSGLRTFHTYLASADSMAWSYGARKREREARLWAPGIPFTKGAANDPEVALAWREQVLLAVESYPIRRAWAAGVSVEKQGTIRVAALAMQQGGRTVYQFSMDGKALPLVAAVSRARRDESRLVGYQRPEIGAHIRDISRYIERPEAVIPSSIVLAFDQRVTFTPMDPDMGQLGAQLGVLEIPIDAADPCGTVVDGQQRMAAMRDAKVAAFNIPCVAMVCSAREQVEQFILVNSTKPLPKALIYELIPTTSAALPSQYERRRYAAELLQRLASDADSPLRGKVRTPTCPRGAIKDNSMLRIIEKSSHEGVLADAPNTASALKLLKSFWRAVAETWPEAWGNPPQQSRLTHGVGISAMGALMEEIAMTHGGRPTLQHFRDGLALIRDDAAWDKTNPMWSFGRQWNELQNVGADIALATRCLVKSYRERALANAA